jgi:hypothetical protein
MLAFPSTAARATAGAAVSRRVAVLDPAASLNKRTARERAMISRGSMRD